MKLLTMELDSIFNLINMTDEKRKEYFSKYTSIILREKKRKVSKKE